MPHVLIRANSIFAGIDRRLTGWSLSYLKLEK